MVPLGIRGSFILLSSLPTPCRVPNPAGLAQIPTQKGIGQAAADLRKESEMATGGWGGMSQVGLRHFCFTIHPDPSSWAYDPD